jgi:hypothetical protein
MYLAPVSFSIMIVPGSVIPFALDGFSNPTMPKPAVTNMATMMPTKVATLSRRSGSSGVSGSPSISAWDARCVISRCA